MEFSKDKLLILEHIDRLVQKFIDGTITLNEYRGLIRMQSKHYQDYIKYIENKVKLPLGANNER